MRVVSIFILAFSLVMTFSVMSASAGEAENGLAMRGQIFLSGWQIDEARTITEKLIHDDADSPEVNYFLGRYFFFRGDYPRALDYLNGAGDYRPEKGRFHYESYLRAAYENTRDFDSVKSEHFELRFKPDKERIIVEAALETLELTYENVGNDLGYKPKDRIIVEFYPKLDMLANATGLTLENLKTSGTIAICKFNRLMVSSPRVSPYGFAWRDTLNHEYVHLLICRSSANNVPVWLHEGLAKFHEERWRMGPGGQLEASAESLLARGIRENKLVTLEEISPSMALLPSQEHAALAFAEVLTMIQWLYGRQGSQGFQRLLADLKTDPDLDRAFTNTYGFDVKGLQQRWKRAMRQRRLRELDYHFDDYSILFDESDKPDPEGEIRKLKKRKGRNLMIIGKLLKDRGNNKAALIEFRKAEASMGQGYPRLQNYLADAYIELEEYDDAIQSLSPVFPLSPNYLPSRIRAAKAYAAVGDCERAVDHLNVAFRINPFDPRVHAGLARCYEVLQQPALAEEARDHLELLRR